MISRNNAENWNLIHDEFLKIGKEALEKINVKLLEVNVRFDSLKSLSKSKSISDAQKGTDTNADMEEQKQDEDP